MTISVVVLLALNVSPLMLYHSPRVLLDVNGEGNVAAWLSSTLLLSIAAVAWTLSVVALVNGHPHVRAWRWSAALFVGLSLDEVASLHETTGILAARTFWRFEALADVYMWVVFLSPLALAIAACLVRFFLCALRDHRPAARWALAGMACWIIVPGVELLEPLTTFPRASVLIEESLEWAGEIMVLHALLVHLLERLVATGRVAPLPLDRERRPDASPEALAGNSPSA